MNSIDDLDLEIMRNIDIRTVDPATLMDIQDVNIDSDKPLPERMIDFIGQIKNPYCFRCGKIVVKISFSDNSISMEERMNGFLRNL